MSILHPSFPTPSHALHHKIKVVSRETHSSREFLAKIKPGSSPVSYTADGDGWPAGLWLLSVRMKDIRHISFGAQRLPTWTCSAWPLRLTNNEGFLLQRWCIPGLLLCYRQGDWSPKAQAICPTSHTCLCQDRIQVLRVSSVTVNLSTEQYCLPDDHLKKACTLRTWARVPATWLKPRRSGPSPTGDPLRCLPRETVEKTEVSEHTKYACSICGKMRMSRWHLALWLHNGNRGWRPLTYTTNPLWQSGLHQRAEGRERPVKCYRVQQLAMHGLIYITKNRRKHDVHILNKSTFHLSHRKTPSHRLFPINTQNNFYFGKTLCAAGFYFVWFGFYISLIKIRFPSS